MLELSKNGIMLIGFKPEAFQYGIGKNAFSTLEDSHLKKKLSSKDTQWDKWQEQHPDSKILF